MYAVNDLACVLDQLDSGVLLELLLVHLNLLYVKKKHTFLKNLLNVFHCRFALLTRGYEDGLKSFVNSGDNVDCNGEVVERFILLTLSGELGT